MILYQGRFIQYTPDFFIITAFDDFEKQPDLKDFLNSNFLGDAVPLATSPPPPLENFLIQQDGNFILQQDGTKIIIL